MKTRGICFGRLGPTSPASSEESNLNFLDLRPPTNVIHGKLRKYSAGVFALLSAVCSSCSWEKCKKNDVVKQCQGCEYNKVFYSHHWSAVHVMGLYWRFVHRCMMWSDWTTGTLRAVATGVYRDIYPKISLPYIFYVVVLSPCND